MNPIKRKNSGSAKLLPYFRPSDKERETSPSNGAPDLQKTTSGKTTLFQTNTKEVSPSSPISIKKTEFPLIALPEFVGLAFWFQVQAFKSNKNEANIDYEARLIWNKYLAPSADTKIFNLLNIPKAIVYLLQKIEISINQGNVQKSIFDPITDFIQQSLSSSKVDGSDDDAIIYLRSSSPAKPHNQVKRFQMSGSPTTSSDSFMDALLSSRGTDNNSNPNSVSGPLFDASTSLGTNANSYATNSPSTSSYTSATHTNSSSSPEKSRSSNARTSRSASSDPTSRTLFTLSSNRDGTTSNERKRLLKKTDSGICFNEEALAVAVPTKLPSVLNALCQDLCTACWNNDLNATRLLLQDVDIQFFINSPNARGQTALYCACRQGHVPIVAELITVPSLDLDAQMVGHMGTALHAACFYSHIEICASLMYAGANVTLKNSQGLVCKEEALNTSVSALFEVLGKDGIEGIKKQYPFVRAKGNSVLKRSGLTAPKKSRESGERTKRRKDSSKNAATTSLSLPLISKMFRVTVLGSKKGRVELVKLLTDKVIDGKIINITLPGMLITVWDDPLTVENTSFSKFFLTRPGLVIIAFVGSHSAIPKNTSQFFNDATTFSAKKIPTVLIGFSKTVVESKSPHKKSRKLTRLVESTLIFDPSHKMEMRKELLMSLLNRLASKSDCSFVQTIPYFFNNFYGNFASFKQKSKIASSADILNIFIDSFVQATSLWSNELTVDDADESEYLSLAQDDDSLRIHVISATASELKKISFPFGSLQARKLGAMDLFDFLVTQLDLPRDAVARALIVDPDKNVVPLNVTVADMMSTNRIRTLYLCMDISTDNAVVPITLASDGSVLPVPPSSYPPFAARLINLLHNGGWLIAADNDVNVLDSDFIMDVLMCVRYDNPSLILTTDQLTDYCRKSWNNKLIYQTISYEESMKLAAKVINLMVEFEMIYLYKLKGVSAYFIPSNLYFQPEKLELQQEFYTKKREKRFTRYFMLSEIPFSFFEKLYFGLSLLLSYIIPSTWSNEHVRTIHYKINDRSALIIRLEAKILILDYVGSNADVAFFCRIQNLVDSLMKFLFFKINCKEIIQCNECNDENHPHVIPLSDVFRKYIRDEKIICETSQKVLNVTRDYAPDFVISVANEFEKKYEILEEVGKGAFGLVRKAKVEDGGKLVAIKSFSHSLLQSPRGTNDYAIFQEFRFESNLAASLKHPNILKQVGVNNSQLSIFQELADCTLGDVLHRKSHDTTFLTSDVKRCFAQNIAAGLNYLQSQNPPICHRDIRSFNIFLFGINTSTPTAKIGDFGLSFYSFVPLVQPMETWQWLAPEVIEGKKYSERSDIYSFGIVVYELLARTIPFSNIDEIITRSEMFLEDDIPEARLESLRYNGYEILEHVAFKLEFDVLAAKEKIQNGLRPPLPGNCGTPLREVLEMCWRHDPSQRPNTEELQTMLASVTFPDETPQSPKAKEPAPSDKPDARANWSPPPNIAINAVPVANASPSTSNPASPKRSRGERKEGARVQISSSKSSGRPSREVKRKDNGDGDDAFRMRLTKSRKNTLYQSKTSEDLQHGSVRINTTKQKKASAENLKKVVQSLSSSDESDSFSDSWDDDTDEVTEASEPSGDGVARSDSAKRSVSKANRSLNRTSKKNVGHSSSSHVHSTTTTSSSSTSTSAPTVANAESELTTQQASTQYLKPEREERKSSLSSAPSPESSTSELKELIQNQREAHDQANKESEQQQQQQPQPEQSLQPHSSALYAKDQFNSGSSPQIGRAATLHDSNNSSSTPSSPPQTQHHLPLPTAQNATTTGSSGAPQSEFRKSQPGRRVFQSILNLSSLSNSSGMSGDSCGDSALSVSTPSASSTASIMTPNSASSSDVERGRSPKQKSSLSQSSGPLSGSSAIMRSPHAQSRISNSGENVFLQSPHGGASSTPIHTSARDDAHVVDVRVVEFTVEPEPARSHPIHDHLQDTQPMFHSSGSGVMPKKSVVTSYGLLSNITSSSGGNFAEPAGVTQSTSGTLTNPIEVAQHKSDSPVLSPSSSPSHASSQPININSGKGSPRLGQSNERTRKERKRDSQDRTSPRALGQPASDDSKRDHVRREGSRDSLLRDVVVRGASRDNISTGNALRTSNPNSGEFAVLSGPNNNNDSPRAEQQHVTSAREHSRGKRSSSSPRKSSSKERGRKGSGSKELARQRCEIVLPQSLPNGVNLSSSGSSVGVPCGSNRLSKSAPIPLNDEISIETSPSKSRKRDTEEKEEKDGHELTVTAVHVQSTSYSEFDHSHLLTNSGGHGVTAEASPTTTPPQTPSTTLGRTSSSRRRSSSKGSEKRKLSSSHISSGGEAKLSPTSNACGK